MLEYSEYKSLVDILKQSDVDNTYEKLMGKESDVLKTVNHVVRHIQDEKQKETQFVHMSLYEIFLFFFLEWPKFLNDLSKANTWEKLQDAFTRRHRIILIGLFLVVSSLFLFFIKISS